MNMHEPPETYKRGPGSGLACQLKMSSREERPLHVFLWECCISIVSIDSQLLLLHYSQTVSHRDSSRPVDRPLLRVPTYASILVRLATIVDGYPH